MRSEPPAAGPLGLGGAEATTLLREAALDPLGDISASVYETARVVDLAPWLAGHAERVEFLLDSQRRDGLWGAPDGYEMAPTLSAVHALLTCLDPSGSASARWPERIVGAVDAAMRALRRRADESLDEPLPDTIAVELIVPALVLEIAELVERLGAASTVPGQRWRGAVTMPAGLDGGLVHALRAQVAEGEPVTMKLWHSLETLGPLAVARPEVRHAQGTVACSPSATAAWLGKAPALDDPCARHLDDLQRRAGGPLPSCTRAIYFERAWILCALGTSSLRYRVPTEILDSLESALGEHGAPGGPGLPPDADDTAAVLLALALHGRPGDPDVLMDYRADDHFACYPGERNPSPTANAHVLEALAHHVATQPDDRQRYASAIATAAGWLVEVQYADGYWDDKWHASPYYATSCSVLALTALDHDSPFHDRAVAATTSAADWVLDTQRADGSWGRWSGTVEETAYALKILDRLPAGHPALAAAYEALVRGRAALDALGEPAAHMGLWHEKDLFAAPRIIHAERLAARAGRRAA